VRPWGEGNRGEAAKHKAVLPHCMRGCGERVRKPSARYIVGHNRIGKKPFTAAYDHEARLAAWCVTACAFCDWRVEDTLKEGHDALLDHLAAQHRERAA
jgi:hypothetical protein